jgi:phasin
MANLPSFEVPQQMRDLAENNITQARTAFDSLMGTAQRGAETMRGSAEQSRTSMQDMYGRGFKYAEENVHAAFDLAQKLARAGTPMEMMKIQGDFIRERYAAMQEQAKAFGGMAQEMFKQGAESTRSAMAQGAGEVRRMTEQGRDAADQTTRAAEDTVDRSKG